MIRVKLYTGPKTPPSHAAGSVLPRWEESLYFGTRGSAELLLKFTLPQKCSGIPASSDVDVCHSFVRQRSVHTEAFHGAPYAAGMRDTDAPLSIIAFGADLDAAELLDAYGLEAGTAESSAVPFPFHRF